MYYKGSGCRGQEIFSNGGCLKWASASGNYTAGSRQHSYRIAVRNNGSFNPNGAEHLGNAKRHKDKGLIF
jgi:hypothetical protein